jgi:methionyl-tRNA formyltransferase
LKIIFFGSPGYSCIVIEKLILLGYEVLALVTKNDKKGKRNLITKTPVSLFGEKNDIKIFSPSDLNDNEFIESIKKLKPDLILIYAYGRILPETIISIPKYGCLNIHCSLLPKWRGAAPIQRALLNNDKQTGVTFFKIDAKLDTGKIVSAYEYSILESDDSLILQNKLSNMAASKLEDVLHQIKSNQELVNQNEKDASYAKKIHKDEAIINWVDSASNISSKIKAFVGWPIAEANILGNKIKIWEATYRLDEHQKKPGQVISFTNNSLIIAAGTGSLEIKKLQMPGRNIITARDLFNSNNKFSQKIKESIIA